MRPFYTLCLAITLYLSLSATAAFAELPGAEAEGWHRWTIDNEQAATIYVRLVDGELIELRTSNYNCGSVAESRVTDIGIVSPDDNFRWFQRIVEDSHTSKKARRGALHGLAQSDSDRAFSYLSGIINN